jgi:hypothetical protein
VTGNVCLVGQILLKAEGTAADYAVTLSSGRVAAVDLSPRVEIAQSADLSTVMTYLVERARDEVRGRVRGTRRADNAQAASRRLVHSSRRRTLQAARRAPPASHGHPRAWLE